MRPLILLRHLHRSSHIAKTMTKRPRLDDLRSLHAPVSPPPLRRKGTSPAKLVEASEEDAFEEMFRPPGKGKGKEKIEGQDKSVRSPFQLTRIADLPESENVDTVTIGDILGDVMIKEAWIFNYMFDLDWVMAQFDPDIRQLVQVKIVHGSWRAEDQNKLRLEEQVKKYPNVKLVCAHMPEAFGTHHSKIFVLFRHDDQAQVIIHTANMIQFDWHNMTQAVWRSPLLPLIRSPEKPGPAQPPQGVGAAFKKDLLAYFAAYDKSRTGELAPELSKYSFESVKAVFVASVPGKFPTGFRSSAGENWGWKRLAAVLTKVPLRSPREEGRVVAQVSSVAKLGQTNTWLSRVLFRALRTNKTSHNVKPLYHLIFPTDKEVRDSLNGYASGSSIHMRIQATTQWKQLLYVRPYLTHWDSQPPASPRGSPPIDVVDAGRTRAAPHIKTYIRFSNGEFTHIDWALLTSANISMQAWGTAETPRPKNQGGGSDEFKVSSYEAGVLVYPEILGVKDIVPVFKKDLPHWNSEGGMAGLRMPYGLPPRKYTDADMPWCATINHRELDWLGKTWEP